MGAYFVRGAYTSSYIKHGDCGIFENVFPLCLILGCHHVFCCEYVKVNQEADVSLKAWLLQEAKILF